jgi:hypothetical protein
MRITKLARRSINAPSSTEGQNPIERINMTGVGADSS